MLIFTNLFNAFIYSNAHTISKCITYTFYDQCVDMLRNVMFIQNFDSVSITKQNRSLFGECVFIHAKQNVI